MAAELLLSMEDFCGCTGWMLNGIAPVETLYEPSESVLLRGGASAELEIPPCC